MYQNDFIIKEVNAYYARRGGIRTTNVHGYANVSSFSSLMQRAVAQAGRTSRTAAAEESHDTAHSGRTAQSAATEKTHDTAHSGRTAQPAATAGRAPQSSSEAATTKPASDSGNICCEQCHATNQLMLQMMSRNLYAQSALNYPLSGYGALSAYQNMANMLGNSLF